MPRFPGQQCYHYARVQSQEEVASCCNSSGSQWRILGLGLNHFTGSIPAEFGEITTLEYLNLGSNQRIIASQSRPQGVAGMAIPAQETRLLRRPAPRGTPRSDSDFLGPR